MSRSPQSPEPRPQDQEPPDQRPPADYVDGVPTFDFVRDRIEGRYAQATGSTELAEESAVGRAAAQQQEDHDAAARERLDRIRRSLRED